MSNLTTATNIAFCFLLIPSLFFNNCVICCHVIQINMKGLDGIQGPVYVGTGCVFRRQALYGIDAPKKKKSKSRTCNCWLKWCCCGLCHRGEKKDKKKPNLETSPLISQRDDMESYALVESGENYQGNICV